MKIISWNCRGLGNPRAASTIQNWCWRFRPNVVFTMETMLDARRLENIRSRCGFRNVLCLDSRGTSRGLGLWWDDLVVQIISYDRHHILADILDDNGNTQRRMAEIYGWPETRNKQLTWEMIRRICNERRAPLLLFGDFNEILGAHEKEGGNPREERKMDAFREVVDDCALRDLGFNGSTFTWIRGDEEGRVIWERLDRFLANAEWCDAFPNSEVEHLPIFMSDHAPIILDTEPPMPTQRRKRRGQAIDSRIIKCRNKLAVWAKGAFGDLKNQITHKEEELKIIQAKDLSTRSLEESKRVAAELDKLHKEHELYWFMRARANELRDRDKNTSYFHHKGTQRRSRNKISEPLDENDKWQSEEGNIERVVSNYYNKLFTTSNPNGLDEALTGISQLIMEDMNNELNKEPSAEEIWEALNQMHPTKAPGPDEAFSTLLLKAATKKKIHGPKVCRGAPAVSHLLFADDRILFVRANSQETATIAGIIATYEKVSGQKINFDKSEISFSKNVDERGRDDIKRLLV